MKLKNILSKFHITLKIGLILLAVGFLPLLIILSGDALGVLEAGNAVGPGIFAAITFWPALILILIGLIISMIKHYVTPVK